MVKVTAYSFEDHARYAGIWDKRGGSTSESRHGLSAAAYQQTMTDLSRDQFRPTHVSVFRLRDQSVFTAIWEKEDGLLWIARHGLSSAEYQQFFD